MISRRVSSSSQEECIQKTEKRTGCHFPNSEPLLACYWWVVGPRWEGGYLVDNQAVTDRASISCSLPLQIPISPSDTSPSRSPVNGDREARLPPSFRHPSCSAHEMAGEADSRDLWGGGVGAAIRGGPARDRGITALREQARDTGSCEYIEPF